MPWLPEQRMPMTDEVRNELIVNCIVVFITLVVVTLRVVGRVSGPGFGWDDALIVLATPMGVAMLICQGVFSTTGSGYNLAEHPQLLPNVPWILQVSFGMQPVYITLLALCKASMLCFYLRIFPTQFMKYASIICLVLVGLWNIACVFASIFLCKPISAQWTGQGVCGAYIPFIQSVIATNAAGDLVVMALPMRSLWHLQKRKTEKLAIMACFSLATAVVVCAIFRIIYISTVDLAMNVTGTMPTTILLFILEPNLAILCVSIPMLRPFFAKFRKGGGSSTERSGYPSALGSGTGNSKKGPRSKDLSTWEMGTYGHAVKGSHDANVSRADDESGSERRLTTTSIMQDEIRVQTDWSVRHD
ncbi:unnamed protein product [Clonostachys rosea f. rosea IK726]|uniref:Rhodopsin domain-containing protein n=2 Tax=Bionectria ochroleuca TaxID=29856 RepID=A0A0B7K7R6_BIOOC|nr:unnamed protein product [Clonostachys rosea f. rosea IK726]